MDEHSWVPNVLSDTGGDVCRNCGVVSECAEIPCKRHPTFRGIPGYPPMHEQKQHDLSTREGCFEAFLEQKRRAETVSMDFAVRLGRCRRALHAADLHGHYTIFQTFFGEEADRGDTLEAENAAMRALMELACADIIFFHSQESGPFIGPETPELPKTVAFSVMVNDVFAPAADAEGFDISEAIPLRDVFRKDGIDGVIRWVQAKRHGQALRPHVEVRVAEREMLRAENASLKATNATLVHDLSHLQDVNCKLQSTITDLQAQGQRLQWQPITPETPWEEATEIATYFDDPTYFFHTEWPRSVPGAESMFGAYWLRKGYTWFRRLNPPAKEQPADAQKGGE